ncbi:MAG: ribonucleoside triphosphate reductase [Hadesarchaea archaeon]|nr:ribonucleoside triphosphate reductase [Hadesarchaea archaeon]
MLRVRKRDGTIEDFNQEKIVESIFRSAQAVGGRDREMAKRLANEVVAIIQTQCKGDIISTEEIGNIVEKVLIERGHARTAKAYILYRKHQEELRKLRSTSLEVERIVDSYIGHMDWRVRENANVDFSLSGLEQHISTTVIANYTLSRLYPMEVADAHSNGDFHIHDLGRGICGYCAGWSLQQLLAEGFNGVPNRIGSNPPKHLTTALLQMVNFMGTLSNEWAGAMAFNSIDTLLAPFIWVDGMDYGEVKQAIQEFVFNLNVTSRFGGQCPFTNVTLDLTVPPDLADKPAIVGGKPLDRCYGDFTEEIEMLNRAFIEVLSEGDMSGRPFTFPIPTYSITKDFEWDSTLSDILFEATAKYGQPYFQNFVNSDLRPSDVRSMCCRLRLDLRELRNKMSGGLFGAGDSTGSMGVVTINMPRLGYLSKNEDEFFERLDQIMELAKRSLEIKREIVEKNMNNGLLPFTKRYLGNLNQHFSTIGLVGMNEALLNLFDQDITTDQGKEFAVRVLKHMRQRLVEFQEETGHLYNLEATPAEGTSYRLALIDKKKYPDIITAGERVPYYTNSSQLPVNSGLDLVEALEHQEDLQTLYTGGTVFHTWLGERIQGSAAKLLLQKMTANTRLPYFTLTPTFSICPDHSYFPGEHKTCPHCGKQTEVYSRVVGYLRPVANWSDGKREEFRQRKYFG